MHRRLQRTNICVVCAPQTQTHLYAGGGGVVSQPGIWVETFCCEQKRSNVSDDDADDDDGRPPTQQHKQRHTFQSNVASSYFNGAKLDFCKQLAAFTAVADLLSAFHRICNRGVSLYYNELNGSIALGTHTRTRSFSSFPPFARSTSRSAPLATACACSLVSYCWQAACRAFPAGAGFIFRSA